MDQLQVGVIGHGYWGPNLLRNFVELPSSNVAAVADFSEERLASVRNRYPSIQTTTDYHDFFTMNIDAVVVATPPETHFAIARDCLEHGKHVLVEKPLTLNSRDARELVDLANSRGLTLMVGHTFEYNAAVREIKRMVESGELGEIYYVDAVRVNLGLFQTNSNVLWDLAPHDVSILRYILGMDPISVRASGTDSIMKGKHDLAYVYLQFPNNVVAHMHVSWLDPRKVRHITIVGSQKMVVYDDIEPLEKIKIYDKGVDKLPYTNSYGDFQLSYRYGDVVAPHIPFTEPLRMECKDFVESCINHTEPVASGWDGLKVVEVLEMAEAALESGCTEILAATVASSLEAHASPSGD